MITPFERSFSGGRHVEGARLPPTSLVTRRDTRPVGRGRPPAAARPFGATAVHRHPAAPDGMRTLRAGPVRVAGDPDSLRSRFTARVRDGDGRQERYGIRMLWVAVDVLGTSRLDDPPAVHHAE